jgi:hypothetical protein
MNRASTELAAQRKLTERMMGVNYDAANKPYFKDTGDPGEIFAARKYDSNAINYTEEKAARGTNGRDYRGNMIPTP